MIANLYLTAKLIPNRKKDSSNVDVTGVDMSTCESRVVVRTSSEVDFVNDGYRWRKYGQKMVKGNANPRYMLAFHFKGSRIFISTHVVLECVHIGPVYLILFHMG